MGEGREVSVVADLVDAWNISPCACRDRLRDRQRVAGFDGPWREVPVEVEVRVEDEAGERLDAGSW